MVVVMDRKYFRMDRKPCVLWSVTCVQDGENLKII